MRSLWNRLHGIQKPAVCCIAIALVFFVLSYLGEHETRAFLKNAKSASGRVSGHAVDVERSEKSNRKDTVTYRARVAFKTPDGVEHSFEGREQFSAPMPPVDTVLDVVYDPVDPNSACINTANELYYSARGMNLAAIIALGIGLFLIVIDRLDAAFGRGRKKELSGEAARRAYYGEPD